MRHLIVLLCALLTSSCSVVNKLFKKEKTKVEVSEHIQERTSEIAETETSVHVKEFAADEIRHLLSKLVFNYSGENNDDSASLELTKTDTGIVVKVSGKAKGIYTETTAEKSETNNQVAEISQKVEHQNFRKIDKNHEIFFKEKSKEEEKKKNKFDFPIWFWLIIGIIALYLLFKGRTNS